MDQKTRDALSKVAKEVPAGTKPTANGVKFDVDDTVKNQTHNELEQFLEEAKIEQSKDPKLFAPALIPVEDEDMPVEEAAASTPPPVSKKVHTSLPEVTVEVPMPEVKAPKQPEASVASQEVREAFQEAVKEPVICPRCNHNHDKQITLTEDETKEYTRSLLAGKPYVKRYALLSGQLKVELRELSSAGKDQVTTILKTLQTPNKELSNIEVMTHIRKIQLLFALVKIGDDTITPPDIDVLEKADAYLSLFDETIGKRPSIIIDALIRLMAEFSLLQEMLVGAAFDSNFWESAGRD